MQTAIQIGAAAGTQVVDGILNSVITIEGGNVLPFRFFSCLFTESDQRNIAAGAAGSIAIKEIVGRNLGGSQTVVATSAATAIKVTRRGVRVLRQAATGGGFVIRLIGFIVDTYTAANNMMIDFFCAQMGSIARYSCGNVAVISVLMLRQQAVRHRAGSIDDEHRCSLRVAGLGRGGRVHLHFQRDIVLVRDNIVFCICCGYSDLADGINAHRQVLNRCAFSPVTVFVIVTNLHVT